MEDTILNEAVRYSELEDVLAALNQGHNPNHIGLYRWSSLHEACSNGDIDIVRCLLEHNGKLFDTTNLNSRLGQLFYF